MEYGLEPGFSLPGNDISQLYTKWPSLGVNADTKFTFTLKQALGFEVKVAPTLGWLASSNGTDVAFCIQ